MKILKLLNKKFFPIILALLLSFSIYAEENPVDIWNANEQNTSEIIENNLTKETNNQAIKSTPETSIYEMQSQNQTEIIKLDQNLNSQTVKIVGLYDPEDFGLDIDMW